LTEAAGDTGDKETSGDNESVWDFEAEDMDWDFEAEDMDWDFEAEDMDWDFEAEEMDWDFEAEDMDWELATDDMRDGGATRTGLSTGLEAEGTGLPTGLCETDSERETGFDCEDCERRSIKGCLGWRLTGLVGITMGDRTRVLEGLRGSQTTCIPADSPETTEYSP
jgi:hypothetical protein